MANDWPSVLFGGGIVAVVVAVVQLIQLPQTRRKLRADTAQVVATTANLGAAGEADLLTAATPWVQQLYARLDLAERRVDVLWRHTFALEAAMRDAGLPVPVRPEMP